MKKETLQLASFLQIWSEIVWCHLSLSAKRRSNQSFSFSTFQLCEIRALCRFIYNWVCFCFRCALDCIRVQCWLESLVEKCRDIVCLVIMLPLPINSSRIASNGKLISATLPKSMLPKSCLLRNKPMFGHEIIVGFCHFPIPIVGSSNILVSILNWPNAIEAVYRKNTKMLKELAISWMITSTKVLLMTKIPRLKIILTLRWNKLPIEFDGRACCNNSLRVFYGTKTDPLSNERNMMESLKVMWKYW